MKNHSFVIFAAGAFLAAASCSLPLETPDIETGGPGRVILTVSPAGAPAGTAGSALTILPVETSSFTFDRYELVFSKSGETDVTITDADITGSGYSQDLPSGGDWTVTVRAYRDFTAGSGPEKEYLAARGSNTVTVTPGQTTPVTVTVKPVTDTALITGQGLKGIFTYTVSFPGGASAELSLGSDTFTSLSSGETYSVETASGEYNLFVSLTRAL